MGIRGSWDVGCDIVRVSSTRSQFLHCAGWGKHHKLVGKASGMVLASVGVKVPRVLYCPLSPLVRSL